MSVRVFVCSLLRYRLTVFLPTTSRSRMSNIFKLYCSAVLGPTKACMDTIYKLFKSFKFVDMQLYGTGIATKWIQVFLTPKTPYKRLYMHHKWVKTKPKTKNILKLAQQKVLYRDVYKIDYLLCSQFFLKLLFIVSPKNLILYTTQIISTCCRLPISNLMVCWFQHIIFIWL